MSPINIYGVYRALKLEDSGYEARLAKLVDLLENDMDFRGFQAAENCLRMMRMLDSGYGFRRESVYIPATLFILNFEALLIKVLNKRIRTYKGYETWKPADMDINRFNTILYCSVSGNSVFNSPHSYIGNSTMKVKLNSAYAFIKVYTEYYDFIYNSPNVFLNNLNNCGAGQQEIHDISQLTRAILSIKTPPTDFMDFANFRRVLMTAGIYFKNISLVELAPNMIEILCRVRNDIAHRGKVLNNPAKAEKTVRLALQALCNIVPADPKYRKSYRDRIGYCLMNPIDSIRRKSGPIYAAGSSLITALVVLLLIWTFAPTPLSERIFFQRIESQGEREKLFDAMARKDTTEVLKIHHDIGLIIKTEDKIRNRH